MFPPISIQPTPPNRPAPFKTSFLIKEGADNLKAGRPERAIDCLDAACAQLEQPHDPQRIDALLQKGKALYTLGRDLEATLCFDQIAQTMPNFAHRAWGRVLVESGRPLEALGHIQIASLAKPDDPVLLAELASLLCSLELLDAAKTTINKAVDLAPRDPFVRFEQGNILWKTGELDEAADSYQRVLEEAPNAVQAMGKLGALLLARCDYNGAAPLLSTALEARPDDIWLLLHHAQALAHLNQPHAAREHLSKTHDLPLTPELQLLRTQVHSLLGQHEECLEECDQLTPLLPNNTSLLILRASVLLALGRPEECRAALEQACKLSPDIVISHTNLGKLCFQMGDLTTARAMLKKARAIDRAHKSVAELGQLLDRQPQAETAETKKRRPYKRRKIADSAKDLNAQP